MEKDLIGIIALYDQHKADFIETLREAMKTNDKVDWPCLVKDLQLVAMGKDCPERDVAMEVLRKNITESVGASDILFTCACFGMMDALESMEDFQEEA